MDNPINIQNAAMCQDGTIIKSLYTHDYQSHDGVVVDGGLSYFRAAGNPKMRLYLSSSSSLEDVYDKMAIDIHNPNVRERDSKGRFTKKKKGVTYKWKLAKDCTIDELHQSLENINNAFPNGGGYVILLTQSVIQYWLVQKTIYRV